MIHSLLKETQKILSVKEILASGCLIGVTGSTFEFALETSCKTLDARAETVSDFGWL